MRAVTEMCNLGIRRLSVEVGECEIPQNVSGFVGESASPVSRVPDMFTETGHMILSACFATVILH